MVIAPQQIAAWEHFYQAEFGISIEPPAIPSNRPQLSEIILVPRGITLSDVVARCECHYPVVTALRCVTLEKLIARDTRTSHTSYAIWTHSPDEAPTHLTDKSAQQLEAEGHGGLTLLERLLFGLKLFTEKRMVLDSGCATLCTGSRLNGELVPYVGANPMGDGISVHWVPEDIALTGTHGQDVHA